MRLLVSGSMKKVGGLAARWPGRLGHILTPSNNNTIESVLATGLPWAADNGCYSGFDASRFRSYLDKIAGHPRCLFVVVPDAVGNAHLTHLLFGEWWQEVHETGQPLAYVGQDGAENLDLPWGQFQAWFIGGSTRWKLSAASADLACEAKRLGKYLHMGRVSTRRRMRTAASFGCDSIDNSSASKFGDKYVHRYCAWLEQIARQEVLFAP